MRGGGEGRLGRAGAQGDRGQVGLGGGRKSQGFMFWGRGAKWALV